MADKENAAPPVAATAGPRLTRAAAKRAAAEAAVGGGAGPAKRKRVALGELPAFTNNATTTRAAKPSKPSNKPAASRPVKRQEARKPAAEPAPPTPPRAAVAEADPDSSASSSSCPSPSPAAKTVFSACSSSPPRGAPAEVDPTAASASASVSASSPPTHRAPDAQLCPAYASDIYTYLRALEADPLRRPRPDYMEAVQKDLSASMRAILVDWLVEVAEEYKLIADTLYLTVYYVDRFLSTNVLSRDKLQLLGVAAMLIAAKYEEISPPHVEDLCYITDNTYTRPELLQMEGDILKLLKFELGSPTIKTFLRRFLRVAQGDKKRSIFLFECMGSYLAELSLLDYDCLRHLPSLVAASVVFLARLTIDPHTNPWNYKLQKTTGYKISELKDCIETIHSLQINRKCSSSTAIREKYKQHKFKFVSLLLAPVTIPTSYLEDLTE